MTALELSQIDRAIAGQDPVWRETADAQLERGWVWVSDRDVYGDQWTGTRFGLVAPDSSGKDPVICVNVVSGAIWSIYTS